MSSPTPTPDIVKQALAIVNGTLEVVNEKPGAVTNFDKIKKYYKFLIAFVGFTIAFLTEILPLGFSPDVKNGIAGVIGFLTSLGVFLKSNEQWVDRLL